MSAHLRGPEAVHEADCAARRVSAWAIFRQSNCTCGAFMQQRILDEFWNSELPSVRKVKRLCKLVDLLPGEFK